MEAQKKIEILFCIELTSPPTQTNTHTNTQTLMTTLTNEQTVAFLAKEYGFKKSEALKKLNKTNKPKRAATGYNLFVADERPRVKASNPDDSTQELMKKVAVAWKALEPEEREEWNAEAAALAADTSDSDPEAAVAAPAKKKAKKTDKPKRAPTGYNLFVAEQRSVIAAENPEDTTQEVMKKVGAAWKALEDEGRADYNAQAKRA